MTPSLVPNPLFDYQLVFNLLLPVAALLTATGLWTAIARAGSPQEHLMAIVRVVAVVALLANFDRAVQTSKECVHSLVHDQLHANPELLPKRFMDKLLAGDEPGANDSFWQRVTKLGSKLFHAVLLSIIILVALVAIIVFFLAYLAQELALEAGVALSPLLVGFLLLPATRSIGVQFLLYMLAIALFPLGWGIASLVSENLIDAAAGQNLIQAADTTSQFSFAFRNFFGTLLLAIWILLSTFVAPFAIVKAVTSGVHITADSVRGLRNFKR